MSVEKLFGHFFKPETRKQGEGDFKEGLVRITSSSDIQLEAFVRASSSPKLKFQSMSMESPIFTAQCSCTSARKGTFCRHMWALLLTVEKNHPDFLDSKRDIEICIGEESPEKSILKEKQKAFRQETYEKSKIKAKAFRQEMKLKAKENSKVGVKSKAAKPLNVSAEAQDALKYFEVNGFVFDGLPSEEDLKAARKELSRVFHPDKGGTHEETIELQRHFEALSQLL